MRRYSLKSFEDKFFCLSALTNEEPIAVYMYKVATVFAHNQLASSRQHPIEQ